ncbi:DNA internalization-related competence protein ComEC/Rec2 [Neobacillus sp. Marseille-QA0830]
MNGRYIYFAIAALFSVLAILISFVPFALLTAIYLYCLYKYKRWKSRQLLLLIISIFIFMVSGFHAVDKNNTAIPEGTSTFVLKFIQDPQLDGDLLQVQAQDLQYHEKILVRYKLRSKQEKDRTGGQSFYDMNCSVTGEMKKPSISKNPNLFNYRQYLATKNIFWIVELDQNPLQNCTPLKTTPLTMVKQIRFNGIRYLEKHFPNEIASLSSALIYGDRSLFDPEILENYQETGLVHLLAISGLHVTLLTGAVFFMGIRIGLTRQFMLNFLLIVLPVYAVLTGASPSVIRSVLMICLVILAEKSEHKLTTLDAISLAFILYLFIQPFIVMDVGFQLSFSVSFAIILSARQLLRGSQNSLFQMVKVSLVSQLSALPCLLFHFYEMSLIGIITNMIYIPLFSFLYLPLSYLLLFIQMILGKTPALFTQFYLGVVHVADNLLRFLGDISLAVFTPGKPPLFLLIVYIVLILASFYCWEIKGNKKLLFCLLSILFSFQFIFNWINIYGEVTMIDVGQGDSLLIHLPHGKGNYLIDTGGTVTFAGEEWQQRRKPFEVGRDVVVPYLKSKGITTIDKLILTHGDMDHVGGAFAVIKELKVKEILMPSVHEPSETEISIENEAEKKNIPVIRVSENDRWENGLAQFTILGPEEDFNGERNSGSIAIFARIGGLDWFTAGDLDQEGEERILQKYPHLQVNVFKAGHHGSKTSNSAGLIKRTTPEIALISVGEHNRFGHPNQEVINRLEEAGATIFRTDRQGAISYRFFRHSGTFFSYLP